MGTNAETEGTDAPECAVLGSPCCGALRRVHRGCERDGRWPHPPSTGVSCQAEGGRLAAPPCAPCVWVRLDGVNAPATGTGGREGRRLAGETWAEAAPATARLASAAASPDGHDALAPRHQRTVVPGQTRRPAGQPLDGCAGGSSAAKRNSKPG